jgi:Rrf2 family protein
MKLSTKGLYSLQLMLDLAEQDGCGFIALKDIARRQGISKKYLEQIVAGLSHAGLLLANRGSQGGYKLAMPLEKYTVGQILSITELNIDAVETPPAKNAPQNIITQFVWNGLKKVIADYLNGITLKELLEKSHEQGSNEYYI